MHKQRINDEGKNKGVKKIQKIFINKTISNNYWNIDIYKER